MSENGRQVQVGSFSLKKYRKTLKTMSDDSEHILSDLNNMSIFEKALLDRQRSGVIPHEFLPPDRDLVQFKQDLEQFVDSTRHIIKTMGSLSPASPIRRSLFRQLKWSFVKTIASICEDLLEKKPTAYPNGYFCNLIRHLLPFVTGEPAADVVRLVQDALELDEYPISNKYG